MKEGPILMNGAMVRASLSGSKTQTRRVVTPQPEVSEKGNLMGEWLARPLDGLILPRLQDITIHCPYGQVGDRLYVRETFRSVYPQDPTYHGGAPIEYDYRATYQPGDRMVDPTRWTPSIHMPRAASRILLEVIGVRVERLQDISEADAEAEGVEKSDDPIFPHAYGFAKLWDSLKPAVGHSWADNPWVWAVNFRRVQS